MVVTRLRLRDFRSYAAAEVGLGERLTVVHGPNGAGKTNLLEALYFGCTGRSCRTTNERELLRFDAGPGGVVRVEVHGRDRDGEHELSVGFQPGEAKRFKVDGAPAERLLDAPHRPLVSVFLPDRLELVKGPPALRRSHLDQVVAALWPGARGHARASTRRRWPSATRCWRAFAPAARARRWRPGTSSSRATASPCATTARAALDLLRPRFAEAAAGARPRRRRGAALPPAHPGRQPGGAGRRAGRAPRRRPRARLHRRTARIATTSRCCATGASCARTARRASSAWACWRCCWPSATVARGRARAHRRCCCSTTS